MTRANKPLLLFSLLVAGSAGAAGLPPGTDASPPKYVDEADLTVYLMKRGDDGYNFRLGTYVYGVSSDSDAVKIDWISKGKTVASQRCPIERDGDTGRISCDLEGKPINASGEVTANLIYIDDQAEKEYLLRTFKFDIKKVQWMNGHSYQIFQDDMLSTAFVWHQMTGDEYKRGDYTPIFYFWVANNAGWEKSQLRCSVNGTRVPDFKTGIAGGKYTVEADYHNKGDERRYRWMGVTVTPENLFFGTREETSKHFGRTDEDWKRSGTRFMGEMVGDWACDLRMDGNVVRQFAFKVNDKGRVEHHPAESAPGFPKLLPTVSLIDMRLPAKNTFDLRVNPAALKKSMRYGMPWPKHEAFDAFKKSLPAASGFADPGKK